MLIETVKILSRGKCRGFIYIFSKDKKLYVQAGAGVVADSVPESEYQETINKSRALILAAELAIEESNQE